MNPCFVQVLNLNGDPIWVNIAHVFRISRGSSVTFLDMLDETIEVRTSPETIIELIAHANEKHS
jgi:hypothetical protein